MSDSTISGEVPSAGTSGPFACSLTGADLRTRGEVIGELFQHVAQVRELCDGYAFTFPGGDEWVHAVMDFIIEERACCPFFTFELVSAAPHAEHILSIRGAEDVKTMISPLVERVRTGALAPESAAR